MTGAVRVRLAIVAAAAGLVASCSVAPPGIPQNTGEYFSPDEYGPASPRVVSANQPVPVGGGSYLIGKPYRVAGKTYIPRDDPRYAEVGMASWYGSAFHGRQTANGEVYDVNGLTAAHPTLPLPSYVRVTNLANGRSLVVRVNDRGPFAHGRIIDVSSRVAEMLDFRRAGTARVKVEYLGPARMDGRDGKTLLASYSAPDARPSRTARWPFGSFLVAAAPTPPPAPTPQRLPDETFLPAPTSAGDPLVLVPSYAPATLADPLAPLIMNGGIVSYAEVAPLSAAQQAAADLARAGLSTALNAAAERKAAEISVAAAPPTIVQLGAFAEPANARRVASAFGRYGDTETVIRDSGGRTLHVVRVAVGAGATPAAVIAAATEMGLSGAFVVAR